MLAARAGLTQTTARQVHEEFLAGARARAEADGTVTSTELKELRRAAKELAATHLIGDLEEAAAADRAQRNGSLKGWRVLPIGDSGAITDLVDFAVSNSASVAVNVTKTVRLVVADDPDGKDPRLAKARAAGIAVVEPTEAQKILDKEIANSGNGLFANPDGQALASQLDAEQAAAARPARPEWHEFWRPRELTPGEYKAQFIDREDDWDARRIVVHVDPTSSRRRTPAPAAKRSGCAVAAVMSAGLIVGIAEAVRHIVG